LPMLERMFEDVKQDAENDGEMELKWRAEIGLVAARIALREQEALENCGIRRKADRIPTEGGQQSDDCGQPMIAA